VPQLQPRLTIAVHRMKAGGFGNRMEAQGWFKTGFWWSNGRSAALVCRDIMVCLFGQGFKACDALIWTLCQQDVRFVGFLTQV
jgi:hypothetical protein